MGNTDKFFNSKRAWSKYKDLILDYYLTPYIPKILHLRKPLFLIDCCAGQGKFDDDSFGSPLIMIQKAETYIEKGNDIKCLFFEKNKGCFSKLKMEVPKKNCYLVYNEDFNLRIPQISKLADDNSLFLYIDPYGVKDLDFNKLSVIYQKIANGKSIEVIITFNARALIRNGIIALGKEVPSELTDEFVDEKINSKGMTVNRITTIAGGSYWKEIVQDNELTFQIKEQLITQGYINELKKYFANVASFPVIDKYRHVPKYEIIFATRHTDGFLIMNDAMYLARRKFCESEFCDGRLFDVTPESEKKDFELIKTKIIETAAKIKAPMKRDQLVNEILADNPILVGRYRKSEFTDEMKKLISSKGRQRLYKEGTAFNKDTLVAIQPLKVYLKF